MKDLISLMDPRYIEVTGFFVPRGGISIHPYANYGRPGTKYESLATQRLFTHEEYLDAVLTGKARQSRLDAESAFPVSTASITTFQATRRPLPSVEVLESGSGMQTRPNLHT